jgi:hypothetical protein
VKIIRNSAKCTACGEEIESTYRHDFKVHWCKVEPQPGLEWKVDENTGEDILVPSGLETFRFGVDGGKAYIRRLGSGFKDTSEYSDASDTNS